MKLECIFSSNNEIDSFQVRDLLEENGIVTMLKNAHTQNIFSGAKMFAGYDPIAGDIEVFVKAEDIEKGLSIIENSFIASSKEIDIVNNELQNPISVSENTEPENSRYKEKRLIEITFLLSFLSILLFPVLFNVKNLYLLFKKKKTLFIFNMILTLFGSLCGIMMLLTFIEYSRY